jgi:hypothetical protein
MPSAHLPLSSAPIGASSPAYAVFVATICNDIACTGGDDFMIQDNTAGDTIGLAGRHQFFDERVRLYDPRQHIAEQACGRLARPRRSST